MRNVGGPFLFLIEGLNRDVKLGSVVAWEKPLETIDPRK